MISSEVFEKLEFGKVLKYISNYAVTEKGKIKVEQIQPSFDKSQIIYECNIVSEAKDFIIKKGNLPLEFITDLTEELFNSRIEGAILAPKKILEIKKIATISRIVRSLIIKAEDYPLLKELVKSLISDKNFENQIDQVLTSDGEVKGNASVDLQKIRKEIIEKRDELTKSINKIIKKLKEDDFVREEYLTLRDGRMVIPVKAEHKRHIKGFIHSESSTGQTVYIEPEETLELNNEIVSLTFAEQREIERILRELTKIIGEKSGELLNSFEIISTLDLIFAKANYSIEVMGSVPILDETKNLHIIEGRHPLLIKKIGRNNTVPLTFKLDKEKIIVITGPNAGGKTVVLKTIGLLTLMLQSGIHIPVNSDSNFLIFNKILLDIGDQQSIEDDLSTFSSHLKNIKTIIEEADENSLVLLDEIGTGTDPTEGSALAKAILIKLLEKSALTFVTTHQGTLKVFAFETEGINNASMQFDHKTLSPTYKFKLGIPGSSYAFEIANKSGLQNELIQNARKLLDADQHKLEKFIADVEAKSYALEKKLNELELENLRLKSLSNLYKSSYEKLEKDKKEIIRKTKEDAEKFVYDLNKKFENTIKKIKESKADKEVIKEGRNVINEIKTDLKKLVLDNDVNFDEVTTLKVGDYVLINNSKSSGQILEIYKEKNKAIVLIGNIKVIVNLNELKLSKKSDEKVDNEIYNYIKTTSSNYRLDIRGKRVNEAEFEIIKFVDDAFQSGFDKVEILHGKGTGALKKLVNEILAAHSGVKQFYYAPIEQGGDGITIVEFK
jgi:DNA mismatch repair protein MutS2